MMRSRAIVARRALSTTANRRAVGADLFGAEFKSERAKVEDHAGHSAELWRKISVYVAIPLVAVFGLHIRNVENEHAAHEEHLKEENGGELPERKVYPYMNMRRTSMPWGMQSLFFNPHRNIPVPED